MTGANPSPEGNAAADPGADSPAAATIWLAAILGLSTALKLSALGLRELWLDETHSALLASMPFGQLLRYVAGDVHPPFYFGLLWGWVHLLGDAPHTLRLFSVILSIVGTVGMFALAREWMGWRAGVFAALLFGFSPVLVYYSLEVRMYMLAVCLVVATFLFYRRVAIADQATPRNLAGLAITAALMFYTHYVGLFVLIGLFADWLFAPRSLGLRLKPLLVTGVLIIALTAPWYPVLLRQRRIKAEVTREWLASHGNPASLGYGGAVDPRGPRGPRLLALAENAASAAGVYPAQSSVLLIALTLPVLVVAAGSAVLLVRGDRVCRLAAIVIAMTAGGFAFLGLSERRFFTLLAPLLILVVTRVITAMRAARAWHGWGAATAAAIGMLYVAGAVRTVRVSSLHPWHDAVALLQHGMAPEDVVVFSNAYAQIPFDYHARQAGFQPREEGFPISIYRWWESQPFKGWAGPVIDTTMLARWVESRSARSGRSPLWLVLFETSYYDPNDALLLALRRRGWKVEPCDLGKRQCTAPTSPPRTSPRVFRADPPVNY